MSAAINFVDPGVVENALTRVRGTRHFDITAILHTLHVRASNGDAFTDGDVALIEAVTNGEFDDDAERPGVFPHTRIYGRCEDTRRHAA